MAFGDSGVDRQRRTFVKTIGVAGTVGLAGCVGGGNGDGNGGGNGNSSGPSDVEVEEDEGERPEADTVLNYWTLFGGGDGVVMASIIEKFNEERPLGDDVAIHRQRLPWDEYYDSLYTSMVGGEAPDMAIMHGSLLRAYDDVITDLSDYIDFSLEDEYLSTYVDFVTVDGAINALPMDYHPAGVYYNKEIFEEAGLDPEDPPSNWEEFEAAGDAIVSETDNHAWVPSPYNDGVGTYRAWSSFVRQAGGQLWAEDFAEPTFDNDVVHQMAQLLWDLTGEKGWAPQTSEENWGNQAFQNGNLGMVTNGTWYVNVMREIDDFDWGFFKPFVGPDAQEDLAWADGHTLIAPRNPDRSDDRTQLVADALHWLTTENPEWGSEAGHLPAARSIHESGSLEESPFYDKTLSKFLEMAEEEQYFSHPQVPSGDPNNDNWYSWLVDTWAHTVEPEEGVQSGMERINNAMD